jgi:hypothetical protein
MINQPAYIFLLHRDGFVCVGEFMSLLVIRLVSPCNLRLLYIKLHDIYVSTSKSMHISSVSRDRPLAVTHAHMVKLTLYVTIIRPRQYYKVKVFQRSCL